MTTAWRDLSFVVLPLLPPYPCLHLFLRFIIYVYVVTFPFYVPHFTRSFRFAFTSFYRLHFTHTRCCVSVWMDGQFVESRFVAAFSRCVYTIAVCLLRRLRRSLVGGSFCRYVWSFLHAFRCICAFSPHFAVRLPHLSLHSSIFCLPHFVVTPFAFAFTLYFDLYPTILRSLILRSRCCDALYCYYRDVSVMVMMVTGIVVFLVVVVVVGRYYCYYCWWWQWGEGDINHYGGSDRALCLLVLTGIIISGWGAFPIAH